MNAIVKKAAVSFFKRNKDTTECYVCGDGYAYPKQKLQSAQLHANRAKTTLVLVDRTGLEKKKSGKSTKK